MQFSKLHFLIFIAIIIIIVIANFLLPKEEVFIEEDITNQVTEEKYIYVHIDGAVNEPGIKEIKEGTRLFELIEMAGGIKEEADISRLNLSSVLKDEQKIIVPYTINIEEQADSFSQKNNSKIQKSQSIQNALININYANVSELCNLAGIGTSTAQKIINYRDENGLFNSIEDIQKVSGIGQAKFDKIKDNITI